MVFHSRHVAGCFAVVTALLAGCASEEQIGQAIGDVNQEFRVEYEGILGENGTHVYKVERGVAYAAARSALTRLGMIVQSQDPALGYVSVYAPAPRPLDLNEWRRAAETDLPRMREIARKHIGMMSDFVNFEPEGLQIVINATVVGVPAGAEISLTTRMREVAPPKSGIPRREYPPPTGVRMALDKIWAAIEQELGTVPVKP